VAIVIGLFGFGISITVDNFHISGKYDSLSIALKIKVISRMGLRGRFFRSLLVIRSWPGDFPSFNFLTKNNISLGEVCLAGKFYITKYKM